MMNSVFSCGVGELAVLVFIISHCKCTAGTNSESCAVTLPYVLADNIQKINIKLPVPITKPLPLIFLQLPSKIDPEVEVHGQRSAIRSAGAELQCYLNQTEESSYRWSEGLLSVESGEKSINQTHPMTVICTEQQCPSTVTLTLTVARIKKANYCSSLSDQEICWGAWANLTKLRLFSRETFTLSFISPALSVCLRPQYSFSAKNTTTKTGMRGPVLVWKEATVTISDIQTTQFSLEVGCSHRSAGLRTIERNLSILVELTAPESYDITHYTSESTVDVFLCGQTQVEKGQSVPLSAQIWAHVHGRRQIHRFSAELLKDTLNLLTVKLKVFYSKNYNSRVVNTFRRSRNGYETIIIADLTYSRDADFKPVLASTGMYSVQVQIAYLSPNNFIKTILFDVNFRNSCSNNATSLSSDSPQSPTGPLVRPQHLTYHIVLNVNAAKWTRLIQLPAHVRHYWSAYHVVLLSANLPSVLRLHSESLTIYLNNRMDDENIQLNTEYTSYVVSSEQNKIKTSRENYTKKTEEIEMENMITIATISVVIVDNATITAQCASHSSLCAIAGSKHACETICGAAATNSTCQWREPRIYGAQTVHTLDRHYATCSPDLTYCPDGHCDAIEKMDSSICPQDCSVIADRYSLYYESAGGVGITHARGVCTCQTGSGPCDCAPIFYTDNVSTAMSGKGLSCGSDCVILVSVVGIILLSTAVSCVLILRKRMALLRHRRRRNRVAKQGCQLQQLLEMAQCGSSHREQQIPKKQHHIAPEWEIERSRLEMLAKLGEGQFGIVMKAWLTDSKNVDERQLVAVKMAKQVENRSGCGDQQFSDLLSEFSTLQLLQHENVCQLLGACLADDEGHSPWLVVEFAELGCLRDYLVDQRPIPNNSETLTISPQLSEELTSFAKQIALGMAYLSQMKMVHRDLATRNILLNSEKVCKISDFGLTRDVYQDNVYTKTTNGLVPVKWMALESLQDSEYTTKSDVWSFGVLLWELATLGRTPYPGIGSDRLIPLLISGYRMPRPEHCSQFMYDLMQRCWRAVPEERPEFVKIADLLENTLAVRYDQPGQIFVNTEYMTTTNSGYEIARDMELEQ